MLRSAYFKPYNVLQKDLQLLIFLKIRINNISHKLLYGFNNTM